MVFVSHNQAMNQGSRPTVSVAEADKADLQKTRICWRISSWQGMLTQACMYGNMDMLKAGAGLGFPWVFPTHGLQLSLPSGKLT